MQIPKMTRMPIFAALVMLAGSLWAEPDAADSQDAATPLKVLIVTGGCCHDYAFQSGAMIDAIGRETRADFTVVQAGGDGSDAQIALYEDPGWAGPYDVVIHNECFGDTADADYIRKITAAHRAGTPAVVVHCAMHTYREAESDDWREFLGVTSHYHEHQSRYPVNAVDPEHPVMRGLPVEWVTPMDELYIVEKLWPGATVLATSRSEKTGDVQPVVWTNDYHGTRVFGTTYGHGNDTFRDPVFLRILVRGLLWAAGEQQAEG